MKLVLALGGNALGNSPQEQLELVTQTAKAIVDLVASGHQVIIGHGNGPQVGMITSTFEAAHGADFMPFAECGAMSQGYIGYHLAQAIRNELSSRAMNKEVSCIITQVEVDKNDLAFNNPTKPIGSFMTKNQADEIARKTGYTFIEDSGRGYRRVVASPMPQRIVELDTINALANMGNIVIAIGGGGIPVIREKGALRGIDAVIDKDMSCAFLAKEIKADALIVLTAVDYVYINYGKANQQKLEHITIKEAMDYIHADQFGKGSMLPKIIACAAFAEGGGKAIITSLANAGSSLSSGTVIEG